MSPNDDALRKHVADTLDWKAAHATFEDAVDGVPPEHRGRVASGLPYSPWQLLEHLRITQRDILDFCGRHYHEMAWPEDYWPKDPEPPSASAWDESVAAYRADRAKLKRIALDPSTDLLGPVPAGTGQTFLREVLLAADHAAYHVGELVAVRRVLGIWKSS